MQIARSKVQQEAATELLVKLQALVNQATDFSQPGDHYGDAWVEINGRRSACGLPNDVKAAVDPYVSTWLIPLVKDLLASLGGPLLSEEAYPWPNETSVQTGTRRLREHLRLY